MTMEGRAICNAEVSFIRSLMSPIIELCNRFSSWVSEKKFGTVGGKSEYPCTLAPRSDNHRLIQPPLNPVCPVMKTGRPSQNFWIVTTLSTEQIRLSTAHAEHFYHAACPSAARSHHADTPAFGPTKRVSRVGRLQKKSSLMRLALALRGLKQRTPH